MKPLRQIDREFLSSSCLLKGPALAGKLELLRDGDVRVIDLTDEKTELTLRQSPRQIWEIMKDTAPGQPILINRIDKVPRLIDYVAAGEKRLGLKFLLTAENERKLSGISGIRLASLHPLTVEELGEHFELSRVLKLGTLPRVYFSKDDAEARELLRRYPINYIRNEIERTVRNVGAFQRFLSVAAKCNGEIIEYASIGREAGVPDNTVKEYYSVLEDTFMGNYLWPYAAGKKSRPRFFFFDCGVLRAIREELAENPNPGLFRTFFIRELLRIRDYWQKDHVFTFWKERDYEIDLLVDDGSRIALAIQISLDGSLDSSSAAFRKRFPDTPLVVASLADVAESPEIKPWREVLTCYEQIR